MSTDFLVIGAGLPRTGTLSLMTALELILPGKCLHGLTTMNHEKELSDIVEGSASDDEFKSFFLTNNYSAGIDAPFFLVYDRAVELFPKAKVILSVRNPEGWVRSMHKTMLNMFSYSPLEMFLKADIFHEYLSGYDYHGNLRTWSSKLIMATSQCDRFCEMFESLEQDKGVEYFNKWIHQVESTVPKERLLKFNVQDGWDPLCEFLNIPQPSFPFPRVNNSDVFQTFANRNKRRSWLLLYEFISIPSLILYVLFKSYW